MVYCPTLQAVASFVPRDIAGDIAVDIATDDAGVWMTYEALAEARDIKRDAARRLAQRHRWRRHTGNDGFARILVPPEWASIARDIAPDKGVQPPEAVAPDVA